MAGCATVNSGYRIADNIVSENNLKKEYIKTGLCTLTVFSKITSPGKPLAVYIEGDGAAWKTRRELSGDPTPRHALALSLAVMDHSGNVAYLARPGQLTISGNPDCDPEYWSRKRFSGEVMSAMNSAINELKAQSKSKDINLVGYSGGATIAIIIASRRNDVVSIRTIAGNLDPEAVNLYHKVTPLEGALSPMDFASKVSDIPQRHFAAVDDQVIPLSIIESFADRIGDEKHESITIVKGASHAFGWQKAWPLLVDIPLHCKKDPTK
ncbi:MAG: alpha/beta hydrolase [Candidatus Omnitrophica bacterium]|nr:alpha/beta hydrolase [Candidatus Omnitrophota bacterium]